MKKTTNLIFILIAAFGFTLFFAAEGISADSDPLKIRVGSPFKSGHILVEAAERFKAIVEKESGGKIAVAVHAGVASEEEINDWCSQGKIEMQSNGQRGLEVSAPQYFFFNAPYVMMDFDHFQRVWKGGLGEKARDLLARNGNMIYLETVYRGLRQMTSKKPIYTPEDARGLKLRLPMIPTWIAVWKEMGAEPVPIPLPQLFASLQEGKADASEGDLPQIASFKLNEVQTHLTLTNHQVQTGGILVNKSFFDGLPPETRQLVLKAMKEGADWANDKMKSGETRILLDLQRKGMQVVIPDAVSFREKGRPAVEALFAKEWPVTTWAEVLAQ
jgi:tripartite ATP-independent transporter DctP family solute receptor